MLVIEEAETAHVSRVDAGSRQRWRVQQCANGRRLGRIVLRAKTTKNVEWIGIVRAMMRIRHCRKHKIVAKRCKPNAPARLDAKVPIARCLVCSCAYGVQATSPRTAEQ